MIGVPPPPMGSPLVNVNECSVCVFNSGATWLGSDCVKHGTTMAVARLVKQLAVTTAIMAILEITSCSPPFSSCRQGLFGIAEIWDGRIRIRSGTADDDRLCIAFRPRIV